MPPGYLFSFSSSSTRFIWSFIYLYVSKQQDNKTRNKLEYCSKKGIRGGDMDAPQAETRKKATNTSSASNLSASLQLLKTCGIRKHSNGVKLTIERTSATPCNTYSSSQQVLSSEGIIKIAREKLLKYASQDSAILFVIANSLGTQSDLSEDYQDVELALLLQASAQTLANRQFDRAQKLLSMCNISASLAGNPVQRMVYYFAEALRKKLDQETGGNPAGQGEEKTQMGVEQFITPHLPAIIAIQQKLPFTSVSQFTGIQAILDNLGSANKIHLIDLGIKSGSHWTILLQALTVRYEFPVERLKITAVGEYKQKVEMIGERLLSFAHENMKLPFPFSFKAVESDMKRLNKDMFELEAGETVAVYSDSRLWSLLTCPNHLEALLRVIKSLNPCVMVVMEAEVNTNRLTFLDRFNESLVLSSAVFDCLETCMERDNEFRKIAEDVYLRAAIQNIIAAEGEERIQRHEKIDFWRDFFARFGIVETELSDSSLYQASLILKRSARWSACSLDMNGHCLIMKWKGTPIRSLSAWKFLQEEIVEQDLN